MNITDSNRFIAALNRIAEGATMLAAAIEYSAWESFEDHAGMLGTRPIAAAQLVQPDLESEAQIRATQSETANVQTASTPEPKDPVGSVSLEQVRGVLSELSQAGHTKRVRELIHATGAERLSEVTPDKYGWLLEQAKTFGDYDA